MYIYIYLQMSEYEGLGSIMDTEEQATPSHQITVLVPEDSAWPAKLPDTRIDKVRPTGSQCVL